MTNRPKSETSLRTVAKILGVAHSSLSDAVRDRRLTAGVAFDGRGRIVVTDAAALAAQWRDVHVPRIDERAAAKPSTLDEVYRRARVDPLVGAFPTALFAVIHAAVGDAPDGNVAARNLGSRAKLGMPDVDELIDREIERYCALGEGEDEDETT